MRIFGKKVPEVSDEDLMVAARLSAVAARHRGVALLVPAEAPRDPPKPRKRRAARSA
jgi:hypothetical protein